MSSIKCGTLETRGDHLRAKSNWISTRDPQPVTSVEWEKGSWANATKKRGARIGTSIRGWRRCPRWEAAPVAAFLPRWEKRVAERRYINILLSIYNLSNCFLTI